MKYVKPTYEELAEQNELMKRKIANLKHYQLLVQNRNLTDPAKIAHGLAVILQDV